jgi:hypothetical protein
MAVTKQVSNQIVSQREQTWRINFEIPAGGTPSIQIYREQVGLDAEGNPVGKAQQSYAPINRTFEVVEEEIATFDDGSEVTFGDVVEALSVFGDKWAEEDASAPPQQPAPPPEADAA